VAESRRLGGAAVTALLAVARDAGSGVLDSVWVDRDRSVRRLRDLGDVVEVFCRAEVGLMRSRYEQRAPGKGEGHSSSSGRCSSKWPSPLPGARCS